MVKWRSKVTTLGCRFLAQTGTTVPAQLWVTLRQTKQLMPTVPVTCPGLWPLSCPK